VLLEVPKQGGLLITLSLQDKPLAAWVDPTYRPAARARFIRHHLHQIRVDGELQFSDDSKSDAELDNIKLLDVPVGQYTTHIGHGKTQILSVSFLGIFLGGVLIIATPDRRFCYIPPLALNRLVSTLEGADKVIWVLCQLHDAPPETARGKVLNGHRLDYAITSGEKPKRIGISQLLLGQLDQQTGAVIPIGEEP
jgi:hypothetical protein